MAVRIDPRGSSDRRMLARVERIVSRTPVLDIHTHLYDPAFRSLLLWGIDELLVYHYLVAEAFRFHHVPAEAFWQLPKARQAELVWDELFVRHSPLSEACRGGLTTLHLLGLDHLKLTYRYAGRDFRLTDIAGHVHHAILS